MDQIDWSATAIVGGSGMSALLAGVRWIVGLYQQAAEAQRKHELDAAAAQRGHEKDMADRYESLLRETLTGFREVEKSCLASMTALGDRVGELGHAVEELRQIFRGRYQLSALSSQPEAPHG